MSISYSKFFDPVQLPGTATTLFTVPAPASTLLRGGRIRFTNTTAGAITVTAYAVPNAGSVGVANAFVSAKSIAANDYLDVDVPIMPSGATLQALASAATSITAHMIAGGLFA